MMSLLDLVLSIVFSVLILLHLSWIAILLHPKKKERSETFPQLSIVIPAHNEEDSIENTINSIIAADYPSRIEAIIVNDGSTDKTREIATKLSKKDPRIRLLDTEHAGKANAINQGAGISTGEVIVTLDADSTLAKETLKDIVSQFTSQQVGGVSGIIRAQRNKNPVTWFQDFEYIQSSTWRYICNKINATYIFPGFAAFRRDAFNKIKGFSTDTYSEDFDIGLRLKKAGYELRMSKATIYTTVPETLKGFIKQRTRWGRGTVQVMKKHRDLIFNRGYGTIGFYGLPTQIYWYMHGLVYLPIFIYQVTEGYYTYFASKNIFLNLDVLHFLFSWFTAYGMTNYIYQTLAGGREITALVALMMIMFVLYLTYNIAIITRYAGLGTRHLLVLFFFFPYSMFSLLLQTMPITYELITPKKSNIWEKSK